MKKNNKPSLSVGIPAYNEENNIAGLLSSILKQEEISFRIEHIFVVCDGCTDNTSNIVKKFSENDARIVLLSEGPRKGKANALNQIYRTHQSDLLLTVDADMVFEGTRDIERMAHVMIQNPNTNIVGPRHIPILPDTQFGKFAYVSYRSFEEAFLRWKQGNNYYAVMSANLIRGSFSKTFAFPPNTISDQCYLWAKATRDNPEGFQLVKDAHVVFRTVNTFQDWRLLGVRSVIGDKKDLAKYFGEKILKETTIPKTLAYRALLHWFTKDPWHTIGSIAMNIYIRKFPYKKMSLARGTWETTMSAKKAIIL